MENDFLKDLNPQQQKAVKDTIGAQIILAGAGSGKTRPGQESGCGAASRTDQAASAGWRFRAKLRQNPSSQ